MAKASKTVTRKKKWDHRDHLPELALPFVEYLGEGRPGPWTPCNYWKVPDGGAPDGYCFSDFLLGRHYALMAAKFLAAHAGSCSGEHLLLYIFGAMEKQRCFDLSRQDKRTAHIAHGFVGQLTELMQFAAKYVRELPVVYPVEPDVSGPAFLVKMPDGMTLVCDPDAPVVYNARVAISRAGQLLGQGVVETKHPARAKTMIVRMDGVSPALRVPGDLDRADIAPIIARQAPGEPVERLSPPARSEGKAAA